MGFNPKNAEEVYIQFDNYKIYFWLGRYSSLSSSYLEAYQTIQPVVDKDLVELDAKAVELFSKAVNAGDLRTAKILYYRYGVSLESRNAYGQTALHVAIQKGHQDIVQWLLDSVEIDLETRTINSKLTPLLFSCSKLSCPIIELLVDAGADVKAVDENGNTAAILAASSSIRTFVLKKTDSPGIFKVFLR